MVNEGIGAPSLRLSMDRYHAVSAASIPSSTNIVNFHPVLERSSVALHRPACTANVLTRIAPRGRGKIRRLCEVMQAAHFGTLDLDQRGRDTTAHCSPCARVEGRERV